MQICINGEKQRSHICSPGMPLAIYREVAAHLRQVQGMEVGLIQTRSQQFDYNESQVGGLWLDYSKAADAKSRNRVNQILAYYGDRYQPWQDCEEIADTMIFDNGLESKI